MRLSPYQSHLICYSSHHIASEAPLDRLVDVCRHINIETSYIKPGIFFFSLCLLLSLFLPLSLPLSLPFSLCPSLPPSL